MTISAMPEIRQQAYAIDVWLNDDKMTVKLSDGREIGVPYREIDWLRFLANATPEERQQWSLEPCGYAIYWELLDDGVEICHLLGVQSLI